MNVTIERIEGIYLAKIPTKQGVIGLVFDEIDSQIKINIEYIKLKLKGNLVSMVWDDAAVELDRLFNELGK